MQRLGKNAGRSYKALQGGPTLVLELWVLPKVEARIPIAVHLDTAAHALSGASKSELALEFDTIYAKVSYHEKNHGAFED